MSPIPHPSVEDLLPPFLAHIPIAFTSPQPPPSLLPLLAPILRSRVCLLSSFTPDVTTNTKITPPTEAWLSLLTWSSNGAELAQSLSQQDFSPHPSGEFEIGEYDFKGVRRTDEETLKCRVELCERGIEVVYAWVGEGEEKDETGGGEGWKIIDVRLVKGLSSEGEGEGKWYSTVSAAEQGFLKEQEQKRMAEPVKESQVVPLLPPPPPPPPAKSSYLSFPDQPGDEDDDDSYWDMYDRSPARTPAVQHRTQVQSEDEYFAQYANVEAALDRGDDAPAPALEQRYPTYPTYPPTTTTTAPTAPPTTTSSSSYPTQPLSPPTSTPSKPPSPPTHTPPLATTTTTTTTSALDLKTPSPRRSGSPSTSSVSALEELASQQMQAETGIKQHISSSVKSLFRLARVMGMGREEFERVVKTELEILELVEEEEEGRW